MKIDELALFGGSKTIPFDIPPHRSIGREEELAAAAVVRSGNLSQFIGTWSTDFFGGPQVQAFERAWEKYFDVSHAISVNSATSGLICALGAIGLEPGDEVITTPWTMSADAAAILLSNAIPVFVDIERETFNLDPQLIAAKISTRTKAILVSDIFGHPAAYSEILSIAKTHNLKVIEDASQSPGARYRGKYAGTLADIGIFSLNYHKHIHTGEGGVCVTNDPKLAEKMQLLRNHGESVVERKGVTQIESMIGYNFRLGEIEAAIGSQQLLKLRNIVQTKSNAGAELTKGLSELHGLKTPKVSPDCSHVYYVYPLELDARELGVSRTQILQALQAEGVPGVSEGYVLLHTLPAFQKKIAFGTQHFPWSVSENDFDYSLGSLPVAEDCHLKSLMKIALCSYRFNQEDVSLVIQAFQKVWKNLDRLEDKS